MNESVHAESWGNSLDYISAGLLVGPGLACSGRRNARVSGWGGAVCLSLVPGRELSYIMEMELLGEASACHGIFVFKRSSRAFLYHIISYSSSLFCVTKLPRAALVCWALIPSDAVGKFPSM